MEVILRDHVDNLGRRGDVVKVAAGYARNYLLPRQLALAVNAADAMDGSGTLTVRVDRIELAEAAITLGLASGCYFRVAVADSGHGMDAATQAQIFEPFFRTRQIGQGTGLGLSIVYGLLRDWKGAVAVDSSPGIGSTFTRYIPVTETT